jgi:hypothetical protein
MEYLQYSNVYFTVRRCNFYSTVFEYLQYSDVIITEQFLHIYSAVIKCLFTL